MTSLSLPSGAVPVALSVEDAALRMPREGCHSDEDCGVSLIVAMVGKQSDSMRGRKVSTDRERL